MRLVYIALGWTIGLFLAAGIAVIVPPLLWLILLAVCAGLASWLREHPQTQIILLSIAAVGLAGFRFAFVPQNSDLAQYNNSGGVTVEGIIIAEPDVRDEQIQLRLSGESITTIRGDFPTDGLVLVQAQRTADVKYGDRIRATGELITPQEYDSFSYADFLARGGVFSIMRNASVEVQSSGHGNPILAGLLNLKIRAQNSINQAIPEPQASLLSGILLGNESGLDPVLSDDFAAVGASHIIAISGFNMVIISGVVMGMLEHVIKRRWLSTLLGILVIVAYTLFVGANAAVIRAAFMSSLLAIAPLFKRNTYVPASLGAVLIFMTALQPTVLWDISFQLSFFAVLGLALFTDPLTRWFDNRLENIFPHDTARFIGGILNEPLIVSIAAQITTLPLIILYFQRLSLVSLLVNILVVPVQAVLLLVGGIAVIIGIFVPAVAQIIYWFDLLLLSWSISVVRWFARLPFADVAFAVDPRLIFTFYLILFIGAIMDATKPDWAVRIAQRIQTRLVLNAVLFSGAATTLLLIAVFLSRPDGNLHVWMLDVGHHNAVLIQTPGGAQMLIDGGRFPSRLLTAIGDRMPFYDREIEVLVITQPDEFNYAALPAVINRYDIGVALVNGQPNLSESYAEVETALAPYDVLTVRAGYTLELDDGVLIEVLNPQFTPELEAPLNDGAILLRVSYGDASFLLTGNISRFAQSEMLENGVYPLTTVMQLPDHGTARSLDGDFLVAAQPQVILLQSDIANRRGDPDSSILAQIGEMPIYRTDESGTLHFWSDGESLWYVGE